MSVNLKREREGSMQGRKGRKAGSEVSYREELTVLPANTLNFTRKRKRREWGEGEREEEWVVSWEMEKCDFLGG